MKVLLISPTFPPMRSGGASLIFELCERLAVHDVELQVITSDIPDVQRSDRFVLWPVMQDWSWRELPRLLRIARQFKPDVVEIEYAGSIYNHHPMVTVLPKLLKLCTANARIVLRVEYPQPVYHHYRTTADRILNKLLRSYWKWRGIDGDYGPLLRDSDKVILLCEPHVGLLDRHENTVIGKAIVIPPSPSLRISDETSNAGALVRNESGIGRDEIVFAYYGYIYPNKGIETLINAFARVVHANGGTRLLMVGSTNEIVLRDYRRPNYLAELKAQAVALRIDRQILWTDYFSPDSDQASRLLRSADACVLPFDDGVLMHRSSVAVAAAHGLPIVTTRGPYLETPFEDGENVVLVPPKDPVSLATAMHRVIDEPELRQSLSRGAKALAEEHFSWASCIARTMHAYDEQRRQPLAEMEFSAI